jgi:hypothetical protein
MAAVVCTIGFMKDNQKQSDRHKPSRMVRLPRVLTDPLQDVADENVTDLTTEVKRAVREYLERMGRWPPKRKGRE